MTSAEQDHADLAETTGGVPVRPVGAWVVAGFLLLATVVMWTLVSVIFNARS